MFLDHIKFVDRWFLEAVKSSNLRSGILRGFCTWLSLAITYLNYFHVSITCQAFSSRGKVRFMSSLAGLNLGTDPCYDFFCIALCPLSFLLVAVIYRSQWQFNGIVNLIKNQSYQDLYYPLCRCRIGAVTIMTDRHRNIFAATLRILSLYGPKIKARGSFCENELFRINISQDVSPPPWAGEVCMHRCLLLDLNLTVKEGWCRERKKRCLVAAVVAAIASVLLIWGY